MLPQQRRWPQVVAVTAVLVLLAGAAAGAWWWLRRDEGPATPSAGALPSPTCRTPTATAPKSLPRPSSINVSVANGTDVNGLGVRTARQLTARGFTVTEIGNTKDPVRDEAAVIRFAPGKLAEAVRLGSYVEGARLKASPKLRGQAVQLWLGQTFDGVAKVTKARIGAVDLPSGDPVCRTT